ncbi:MAG: AAA family ATPase [Pirellulales bacterium]
MRVLPDTVDFDGAVDAHVEVFNQAIEQCFELYRSSGQAWNASVAAPPIQAAETLSVMDDLARGLMIKIFLAIVQAGQHFGAPERQLAQALALKLWGRAFTHDEIGTVLLDLIPLADKFNWYHLVRPFDEVPVLRERIDEVETAVIRFGNLVAKADGKINADESARLKGLLAEVNRHLRPVPLESGVPQASAAAGRQEIRRALDTVPGIEGAGGKAGQTLGAVPSPASQPTNEQRLQTALQSLDELIGLDSIKNEIRELTRFLRVQQQREQAGLPRTQVSLHTVFAGNPGTGKTSVARVLGEVFGALGIVRQGHLIEADRSTLVAGYMGQTAERTNKIVDSALDGVLFIDEAYSLVSDRGDDPFGQEAVQILLKRMEDNRGRLIVVLAGYSDEMQRLLGTNPGLASRFQRTFDFPDFTVVELCRIFQSLCEKNHYSLPPATRARLVLGFAYLLAAPDPHFGNGRVVRNVFERAIRRLANRIADVAPLTKELLTRLEPEDIFLDDVPAAAVGAEATCELAVNIVCPGCKNVSRLQAIYLGRRAQCNKCQVQFTADWGEPVDGA